MSDDSFYRVSSRLRTPLLLSLGSAAVLGFTWVSLQQSTERRTSLNLSTLGTSTTVKALPKPSSEECCFTQSLSNLEGIFIRGALEGQNGRNNEDIDLTYDEWVALRDSPLLQPATPTCEAEWNKFVIANANIRPLNTFISFLQGSSDRTPLAYMEDTSGLPRVLYLGDSISLGTTPFTQDLYGRGDDKFANIHSSPGNCGPLERFDQYLELWLGECPWDLIQFNVGAHYHPDRSGGLDHYYQGLEGIIERLIQHSPDAKIVFALTTPSPFDSRDTRPTRDTCRNFDKLHHGGVVPSMNTIARKVGKRHPQVTINDRFATIYPFLAQYQLPCNIHFNDDGYEFLAQQDWKVASDLLQI